MKKKLFLANLLSSSLLMLGIACDAKNEASQRNSSNTMRNKTTKSNLKANATNQKILNIAKKLDVLSSPYLEDVKQVKKDILFLLTKTKATPQQVLPYLSNAALRNSSESQFIPWCFERVVEEKDDIKLMQNLLPLLQEDRHYYFYHTPNTGAKLSKLAQRVSDAQCTEYWQKFLKYRILERLNLIFLGYCSTSSQLDISNLEIKAANECPGFEIKVKERLLHFRKQYQNNLIRQKQIEDHQNSVDSSEQRQSLSCKKKSPSNLLRKNGGNTFTVKYLIKRGDSSRSPLYSNEPLTYAESLIDKGDLALHSGDNLRANRFYCVAKIILETYQLENSPCAKQLKNKIEKTDNFDADEEYWKAKFKVIIRELRCTEGVRAQYKRRAKYLEYSKKHEEQISLLKTDLKNLETSKHSNPSIYMQKLLSLSDKYRYRFSGQMSINPEYIADSTRLRLKALDIFINSEHKTKSWKGRYIEDMVKILRSIEMYVPEKQFEKILGKLVAKTDALNFDDNDEYSDYRRNLIKGKPNEDDSFADEYEIDYPYGRPLEKQKFLENKVRFYRQKAIQRLTN